jgi:glycosyltransferase involved in cell wall biosynthesis
MTVAPRLCYFVERLGPYHVARLNEVARSSPLSVVELTPRADTYLWSGSRVSPRFEIVEISALTRHTLSEALRASHANVVFVNGWSDRGALLGLSWCRRNHIPVVLMSDSQRDDEPRTFWKESVKRLVVCGCNSGFVAGRRHVEYLQSLGMAKERIVLGYDVIDNDHFRIKAEMARHERDKWRAALGLPQGNFFLCVARFLKKKNLPAVLRAFASYRKGVAPSKTAWDLVLAGDGPLRGIIEAEIASLSLTDSVCLIGFRQYDELPACYGLAGAFVLGSTSEQWGLVVNEAMATGLPVVISRSCGCVPELVDDGVNGFQFDPHDEPRLAELMSAVAGASEEQRAAWGEASRRIISDWTLDRFARGVQRASEIAKQHSARCHSRFLVPWMLNLIARFR